MNGSTARRAFDTMALAFTPEEVTPEEAKRHLAEGEQRFLKWREEYAEAERLGILHW